jgi:hypothetical protein
MLILDAGAFIAAERDILTSDPADLLDLARAAGTHLELIPI